MSSEPRSAASVDDLRSKLAGWHFAKESLTEPCSQNSTEGTTMATPADSVAESPQPEPMDEERKLTDYEKGYLDGLLAYAYRSGDGVYVGRNRFATYEHAVTSFLRSRGIHGWKVKVH